MTRPPFSSFPELESQRLHLREYSHSDASHLVHISFYNGSPAKDADDAKIMNEKITDDYENGHTVHWIIASRANGEVLGTCGFYRGFNEETGEIGYVLKKEHQGKGYMSEAVGLMVDFGFNGLGLKSIVAETTPENLASIHVLKRCGFGLVEVNNNELKFRISQLR